MEDPHLFSRPSVEVREGFSVITALAVTPRITINYCRANFVLSCIFITTLLTL